jgi:hypothetical protein
MLLAALGKEWSSRELSGVTCGHRTDWAARRLHGNNSGEVPACA